MRDQDIRIGSQLTTRRPGLKVLALVRPRQLVPGESVREFEGVARPARPGRAPLRAGSPLRLRESLVFSGLLRKNNVNQTNGTEVSG